MAHTWIDGEVINAQKLNDYADDLIEGVSPEVTIENIQGGTKVTITDKTHPEGQSFNVMNGGGSGDMQVSVYDSDNTVANAGGIKGYAQAKGKLKIGETEYELRIGTEGAEGYITFVLE